MSPTQVFDNTTYAWSKNNDSPFSFRGPSGPFFALKSVSMSISDSPFLLGLEAAMGLRMGVRVVPGMQFQAIPLVSLWSTLREYAALSARALGGEHELRVMLDRILPQIGALSNLKARCGQFRTHQPFFPPGYDPNPEGANVQQQPVRWTREGLSEFESIKSHLAEPLKEYLKELATIRVVDEHIGTLGELVQITDKATGHAVTTWPQTYGAFMPSDQLVSTEPGKAPKARGE